MAHPVRHVRKCFTAGEEDSTTVGTGAYACVYVCVYMCTSIRYVCACSVCFSLCVCDIVLNSDRQWCQSSLNPCSFTALLPYIRLQIPLFHGSSPQQPEATSLRLQVKWSIDTGKCVDASPLLVHLPPSPPHPPHTLRSMVYIGSHSGQFLAIDWELGLVLWRMQLGDRIESSATLSACGGYTAVGQ